MKKTPTSGRKVTRESNGQVLIAGPPSPRRPEHVPGDQQDKADHHCEGIVVEIAALQPDRAMRQAARCACDAVRAQAVDQRPVTQFPQAAADEEGRAQEYAVIELVEIPLVVGETV